MKAHQYLAVFILIVDFGSIRSSKVLPSLDFRIWREYGRVWEDVSHLMPNNKMAFFRKGVDDYDNDNVLCIDCTAPFPIHWNVSGLVTPNVIFPFRITRDLSGNKFDTRTCINEFQEPGASFAFSLRCEKIGDPEVMREAFVFIYGDNSTSSIRALESNVKNSKVIPCVTVDPTAPKPQLIESRLNGTKGVLQNQTVFEFHHGVGFKSSTPFEGKFICRQGVYETEVTASLVKLLPPPEYSVFPNRSLVELRPLKPNVVLECISGKEADITFVVENSTILSMHQRSKNGAATATVSLNVSSSLLRWETVGQWEYPEWAGTPTKISCVSQVEGRTELIYEWTIEWEQEFALVLDNIFSRMHCQTRKWNVQSYPISMQILPCSDPNQCDFLSKYASNHDRPGITNDGTTFINTTKTHCQVGRRRSSISQCVELPYTLYSGIVDCKAGPFSDQKTFFTSLNFLKYQNWKDAPENELVRMDPSPCVLRAKNTTTFGCEAVKFLFTETMLFRLEFRNGSKSDLVNGRSGVEINEWSHNRRHIYDFNIINRLEIRLPRNAVAVHCGAALVNSNDIIWTQTRFTVIA